MVFAENQELYNVEILNNFFTNMESKSIKIENKSGLLSYLDEEVNAIQNEIQWYLNEILKDKKFKELEGSWLSIYDLIKSIPLTESLKVFLFQANCQELKDDIADATDFDQSYLFKKFYEENYGTPGGLPVGLVIFDHYFTKNPQDVQLMGNLTNILAAAHINCISGVDPSVFDIKSFSQLNNIKDLQSIFESPELIQWNSFRTREESRYMTLVLPKVLKRIPYDNIKNPIKTCYFNENINADDNNDFCWGNAAYKMGECIMKSFFYYKWLAAIRGVDNGGKVENIPIYTYRNSAGETISLCPTETPLTDRREKELSELGFLSLCYFKQTDYGVFFGSQTMQKPLIYDNDEATGNSHLSASLPYMLNVSRFAHYMKCMMRDYVGSHTSKEDIEQYLQNWISRYVTLNDTTDNELKVKFPLRGAMVTVEEDISKTGVYFATVKIIPHFQLEAINISMRLVVSIKEKS